MTKTKMIIGYTKNIALFLFGAIIVTVSFPAYIIYAFGKTLCDKDEISDFYESLWETMMGLKNLSDVKVGARQALRENKKLKQYIEDIKKAPYQRDDMNEAAKYNAMWDVIYKYNEEFNIED